MWRSGATQRRGARGAPQGRRCTYVLLCAVVPLSLTFKVNMKSNPVVTMFQAL